MKTLLKLACLASVGFALAAGQLAAAPKNWTPPATKICAQTLAEEIMANHPELLSITFHGVPPGLSKVYTMFAGSYLDRIGNADDPDDIDVIVKGITIVDPRWGRHDPKSKFVMMMPLRDAEGKNIGLLVAAYKFDPAEGKGEKDFFLAGTALRDDLAKKIPSFEALFKPAN